MPPLSNAKIETIEQALGRKLHGLYHRLLFAIGPGAFGKAAEIYHPLAVREVYEPFFDDPAQWFNPHFPFVCQNAQQELWILDASAEKAASIWHETVPDDWPEEEWLEYDKWIKRYLEPEGRESAP